MPRFDRNNYVDVQTRINLFHAKYPDGAILTELMSLPDDAIFCRYKATVWRNIADPLPAATGFATENAGTTPQDGANFGSHEENAETSAIGRALANLGFAKTRDDRPSAEEIDKVNRRQAPQPRNAPATRQDAPGRTEAPSPDNQQATLDIASVTTASLGTNIDTATSMKELTDLLSQVNRANIPGDDKVRLRAAYDRKKIALQATS